MEMLVVMAIIGVMSLVSVPAFMKFYWSNKMKTSLRQFTTEVRSARQRAITENHPTMLSYDIGTGKRQFQSYNGAIQADGSVQWTVNPGPMKIMEDIVYFARPADCLFANDIEMADTSGWNDIIFRPNGTVQNVPAPPCGAGKVTLRTDYKVPRQNITVEFFTTGRLKAN
jgi:type II secretory pathway pseudopilin PulG